MTKAEFLATVAKLYTVGNLSDSDSPQRQAWTKPAMAGVACCAKIDAMISAMVDAGVITEAERQRFYDVVI